MSRRKVTSTVARAAARVAWRRARHGPLSPPWSVQQEVVLEVARDGFRAIQPVDVSRKRFEAVGHLEAARRRPVTYREEVVGGVRCLWATPPRPSDVVLVYLHGGAYVIGSPESHRGALASLAMSTGARVLAPDYRRAPENPCPAAIDDAVAVWRDLIGRDGIDPSKVVMAGDSAGGGLTLTTSMALRDAGDPLPRGLVLLSPWTDLTIDYAIPQHRLDRDYLPSTRRLHAYAEHYLDGMDRRDPRASPLFGDLGGLPPMQILAGGVEIILPDSVRLASAVHAAGGKASLHVEPWEVHVYPMFLDVSAAGRRAFRDIGEQVSAWTA